MGGWVVVCFERLVRLYSTCTQKNVRCVRDGVIFVFLVVEVEVVWVSWLGWVGLGVFPAGE